MSNESTGAGLLRMIGFMGVCVGVAWALQIVAFGDGDLSLSRLVWVLAAASIAGASVGLMLASGSIPVQTSPVKA